MPLLTTRPEQPKSKATNEKKKKENQKIVMNTRSRNEKKYICLTSFYLFT